MAEYGPTHGRRCASVKLESDDMVSVELESGDVASAELVDRWLNIFMTHGIVGKLCGAAWPRHQLPCGTLV